MVELELNGFLEEDEEYSNVPKLCPKCGQKLQKTDALKLCNILFVFCPAILTSKEQCRWCCIFELP